MLTFVPVVGTTFSWKILLVVVLSVGGFVCFHGGFQESTLLFMVTMLHTGRYWDHSSSICMGSMLMEICLTLVQSVGWFVWFSGLVLVLSVG